MTNSSILHVNFLKKICGEPRSPYGAQTCPGVFIASACVITANNSAAKPNSHSLVLCPCGIGVILAVAGYGMLLTF